MPKIVNNDPRLQGGVNYVAAGVAGGLARLAVNPMSNVKIYMQTGAPGTVGGTARCLYWNMKMYGRGTATRAAMPAALRIVPHYALKFAAFDRLASTFGIRDHKGSRWPHPLDLAKCFVAGATANGLATLVTHPLDVLKVRLVAQPPGDKAFYSSTAAAWAHMSNEGIFRGAYRGLGLSLIGGTAYGGFSMLAWWTFERVPWRRMDRPGWVVGSLVEGPILAIVLATAAASAAYPIDVLRRRFMAQSFGLPNDGNLSIRFRNVAQMIVEMYKHQGIFGFFNGNLANVIKIAPQMSIFWLLLRAQQNTLSLAA